MYRNLALGRPDETGPGRPGPHEAWADRPALVGRLTATEARLILLGAPAGYGKTALVEQWRAHSLGARSFAWISLDRADNRPRTLWRHVTEALSRAFPEMDAAQILCHLRTISPDITGTVIPLLVNEMAALNVPAALVLDDYHSVSEAACHDQMAFLIHHLPASVQVVAITRADPPLPLARWRANGEMAEFRADDLRFSAAEAALVARAVCGPGLSEFGLARLMELSEGWPAGLYLAARSVRGYRSHADFARRSAGASPAITDFIAAEVLSRQPADIRRFLARTSILGRFCAPLCDAVTGSADGARILAALQRDNAFIVPLDQTRQWFRYHRMFAQVLRQQLDRTEPAMAPVLHRRASQWYRRSGSATAAIEHAIAAGDSPGAVDLIAANWYAAAACGQAATVRGWLRKLDERAISAHPVAAHCAAWSAATHGDQDAVRRWLPVMTAAARGGPLPDRTRSLGSSAALLRGYCGFDSPESMSASAERAAELESDPSSPWYATARTVLGFSRYLTGDAAGAERALTEAASGGFGLPEVRLLGLSALSLTAGELNQPERARRTADSALSFMAGGNLGQAPPASLAFAAAGAAHARAGQLHQARGDLEHAFRLRRQAPGLSVWATIDIMLRLAMVAFDVADRPAAAAAAEEAALLLADSPGGARALRARLRRLEHRLEGYSRALTLPDPLTEREVMVLQLLASALPLREIAAVLGLSVNTVKSQVRSVYLKLGVSARRDAVARGRRSGVLEYSDQM